MFPEHLFLNRSAPLRDRMMMGKAPEHCIMFPGPFPVPPLRVTMIMDNAPEYCFMSRPYQLDYWEGLLHHLNHKILHE